MQNIAPGLFRNFVSESWPTIGSDIYEQVKEGAERSIKNKDIKLIGYDIDGRMLKIARSNSQKAGVSKYIEFQKRDFKQFSSSEKNAFIITNPPYGERLGEKREVEELYKYLGMNKRKLDTWDFNILTSYEGFETPFGRKATKNRKLYNGKLKCYYYQYFDNEKIKNHGDMVVNHI